MKRSLLLLIVVILGVVTQGQTKQVTGGVQLATCPYSCVCQVVGRKVMVNQCVAPKLQRPMRLSTFRLCADLHPDANDFVGCINRQTSQKRKSAHAQQPPKPEPIKLNPEASAGVVQAENDLAVENARHQAEVKRLTELQSAYLKGAGVPKDFTQCVWDAAKIVICSKPAETAKVPK